MAKKGGNNNNGNNNSFWSSDSVNMIDQLTGALTQLNSIMNNTNKELRSQKELLAEINNKQALQNDILNKRSMLIDNNVKSSERAERKQKDYNKQVEKLNKMTNEELIAFNELNELRNENKKGSNSSGSGLQLGWKNVGSNYSNIRSSSKKVQNKVDLELEGYIDKITKLNKASGGKFDDATIDSMIDNKQGELLNNASNKFQVGASVIQVAADVLKAGADIFMKGVKDGIANQSGAYESSFTNIAVRTGASKEQYLNTQWDLDNNLESKGLLDNVGVSDVQKMWDSMATSGVAVSNNEREMFTNAIDNVVTNKIVPYLDTGTVLWDQLTNTFGQNFTNQIRGIQLATMETAGNSYLTEQILNEMLPTVQYMGEYNEGQEALQIAESSGMLNYLMSEEGGSMSQADAMAYVKQYSGLIANPGKALTSGSVIEKQALVNMSANNINPYDTSQTAEAMGTLMSTEKYFADSLADPTSSLSNAFATDIAGSPLGFNSVLYTKDKQNTSYNQIDTGVEAGNQTGSTAETTGQLATDQLTNGDFQTAADTANTWLENIATNVAVLLEQFPIGSQLIQTAVTSLGTVITSFISGKIIGGTIGKSLGTLGGTAAGGTGSGIIGTISPMLAVGGGIALGFGVAELIKNAIVSASNEEIAHEQEIAKDEAVERGHAVDNEVASDIIGMGSATSSSNNNFGNKLGASWSTTTRGIGTTLFGWTRDVESINKDDYAFFTEALRISGKSDDWKEIATLAYGLLLMSAGRQKDVEAFSSWTNDDVKNVMETQNWSPSLVDLVVSEFSGTMPHPNKSKDEEQTTIDWDKMGIEYHRLGLEKVPYDNYAAMLHKDEAVLTASTAEELRNLTYEYKTNKQESINLDTIIQNQTNTLVAELQAIKSAITSNAPLFSSSTSKNSESFNNMKHIRSTGSFT